MKEYECRKCNELFEPSDYRIKRNDIVCNVCANKRKKEAENRKIKQGHGSYKYKYKNEEKRKEYQKNYQKGYSEKKRLNPEITFKASVRYMVNNAIKAGKLIKKPCEICSDEKSEAHHIDYNKPFNITWLCKKHHGEWHKTNKAIDVIIN